MGCLSSKQAATINTAATQRANSSVKNNGSATPASNSNRRPSRAGVHELKQQYNINKKVLGSGSFGKVFQAENKADPSH